MNLEEYTLRLSHTCFEHRELRDKDGNIHSVKLTRDIDPPLVQRIIAVEGAEESLVLDELWERLKKVFLNRGTEK